MAYGQVVATPTALGGGVAATWAAPLWEWSVRAHDASQSMPSDGSSQEGGGFQNAADGSIQEVTKEGISSGDSPRLMEHGAKEKVLRAGAMNSIGAFGEEPNAVRKALSGLKGTHNLRQALQLLSTMRRAVFFNPATGLSVPMAGFSVEALRLGGGAKLRDLVESLGPVVSAYQNGLVGPESSPDFVFDLRSIYSDESQKDEGAPRPVNAADIVALMRQHPDVFEAIAGGFTRPHRGERQSFRHKANRVKGLQGILENFTGDISRFTQGVFAEAGINGSQRAVLILRELLGLTGEETRWLTGYQNSHSSTKARAALSHLNLYLMDDGSGVSHSPGKPIATTTATSGNENKMEWEEETALKHWVGPGLPFATQAQAEHALKKGRDWLERNRKRGDNYDVSSLERAKELTLFSALLGSDGAPRAFELATPNPKYEQLTKFQSLIDYIRSLNGSNWAHTGLHEMYLKMRGLGPLMRVTTSKGKQHWLSVSDVFTTAFSKWTPNMAARADNDLLRAWERATPEELYALREKALTDAIESVRGKRLSRYA